jgi:hypothetical protein
MLSAGSVFGVLGSAALGMGAGVVALMLTTSHPAAGPARAPVLAVPAATATAAPAHPEQAAGQAQPGSG